MEVMRQKPRKKTRSCPDNHNTNAMEMFCFSRDDMPSPEIELLSSPDSKKKPIKTQLDTRVALDRPSFASPKVALPVDSFESFRARIFSATV